MTHYFAVVHQEGDSAYGVHFPDVPGCFAAADDQDDLAREAASALALHLEDEIAPTSRSISEIRNDKAVLADVADGAFLLAVPLVQISGRTVKANITMDAGLLGAVDEAAKRLGLTRSAFLADVARREIVG
jgi:predicted RNase H-like HicB family nuclease